MRKNRKLMCAKYKLYDLLKTLKVDINLSQKNILESSIKHALNAFQLARHRVAHLLFQDIFDTEAAKKPVEQQLSTPKEAA